MANPKVANTASLTFGTTTYKMKSMPSGRPRSVEAVDVTTLSDNKKQFAPGALVVNGEINATIAGDSAPALNSKSSLTLTVGEDSVSCGQAICRSATPTTIEVGGNRERAWECVFQPVGAAPSAPSASSKS